VSVCSGDAWGCFYDGTFTNHVIRCKYAPTVVPETLPTKLVGTTFLSVYAVACPAEYVITGMCGSGGGGGCGDGQFTKVMCTKVLTAVASLFVSSSEYYVAESVSTEWWNSPLFEHRASLALMTNNTLGDIIDIGVDDVALIALCTPGNSKTHCSMDANVGIVPGHWTNAVGVYYGAGFAPTHAPSTLNPTATPTATPTALPTTTTTTTTTSSTLSCYIRGCNPPRYCESHGCASGTPAPSAAPSSCQSIGCREKTYCQVNNCAD